MSPHHVWYILPAWGHMTAGHAMMAEMLEANPELQITYVSHVCQRENMEKDLYWYPPEIVSRIRLVPSGSIIPPQEGVNVVKLMIEQQEEAFRDLIKSLHPQPTKFIIDVNHALRVGAEIKFAFPEAKIFGLYTCSAIAWYNLCAPIPHGAVGYTKVVDALENSKSASEGERQEMLRKSVMMRNGYLEPRGLVVKLPGLPEMYDYEREAENTPMIPAIIDSFMRMVDYTQSDIGDGTLLSSSMCLEGDSIRACNDYFPAIAPGVGVTPRAWTGGQLKDGNLKTFLDGYGSKEVVFMSFGSLIFPLNHVEIVLDVLIEMKKPYILVWGGSRPIPGGLPPGIVDKSATYEHGLFAQGWVDQVGILNHPSTDWFITHCGWNSIIESILAGIPMIAWPLAHNDECQNAAWISTRPDPLGFELCQIREGYARQPALRGINVTGTSEAVAEEMKDVLIRAGGTEGDLYRDNVRKLGQMMREERAGRARDINKAFASH